MTASTLRRQSIMAGSLERSNENATRTGNTTFLSPLGSLNVVTRCLIIA